LQLVLTHPTSLHISNVTSGMASKQHTSGSIPKEPALIPPNHEDADDLHTLESKSFGEFSIDTWDDILDYVESPSDLYSLALTSRTLYNLALPHLYKAISIRSPHFAQRLQPTKSSSPSTTYYQSLRPPSTSQIKLNLNHRLRKDAESNLPALIMIVVSHLQRWPCIKSRIFSVT
jgi:hypothetical protein